MVPRQAAVLFGHARFHDRIPLFLCFLLRSALEKEQLTGGGSDGGLVVFRSD